MTEADIEVYQVRGWNDTNGTFDEWYWSVRRSDVLASEGPCASGEEALEDFRDSIPAFEEFDRLGEFKI